MNLPVGQLFGTVRSFWILLWKEAPLPCLCEGSFPTMETKPFLVPWQMPCELWTFSTLAGGNQNHSHLCVTLGLFLSYSAGVYLVSDDLCMDGHMPLVTSPISRTFSLFGLLLSNTHFGLGIIAVLVSLDTYLYLLKVRGLSVFIPP